LVPALALGYYLTQYITKSLRKIGEKLKTIKINQKNEELQWEGKDEIGLLVSEYNKKVAELEESAKKLAQTERESAWREMAKQVAHEIKNPLTPMKLSVQQLERTWKDGGIDFDSRLERFAKTMTEQIDALTQIANEFSNFAKMPKTEITSVNIKDSILSVVDLFKKSQTEINFSINLEHENTFVLADKNEFIRVFNNLIKNAIQAIPKNQEGIINIDILSENKNWKISITDNGVGIPKNSKNNLFVPNFTTKTTGMGLGLAMVKNIIDGIGGQIWFESEENKGTTFFILLNKA
jgi:nitrogen fixation/metabolism regulation signal transduction histidine kinase